MASLSFTENELLHVCDLHHAFCFSLNVEGAHTIVKMAHYIGERQISNQDAGNHGNETTQSPNTLVWQQTRRQRITIFHYRSDYRSFFGQLSPCFS